MSDTYSYPRRLYMRGEVFQDDPHATNSVVVKTQAEEVTARRRGYRVAWEGIPVGERVFTPKNSGAPTDDDDAEDSSAAPSADDEQAAAIESALDEPATPKAAKRRRSADAE